jgi:glycosyltransferase involved in cell wall biosynthesis
VFRGCSVAVVIPAFNEADKIAATLRTVPPLVDHVLIVDDGSRDGTAACARVVADPRVEVMVHVRNRGVGAAISSGYARALEVGSDVVAVMAGDGQMDPADLPRLLTPVVEGGADYAKGNRLAWPGAWREMPAVRLAGTVALAWLTGAVTGYRRLSDSQCGYTAISRSALLAIGPARMYPRYGYPNDILARLSEVGARVVDVPVRPVYGPAWRSGLRPSRVIIPLTGILARAAVRRATRRRDSSGLSRGKSGSPRQGP